ncbi:MAG: hypothetical protein DI589_02590 [Shinella sp.]|nr:MAG: hypothetical protein DI589_02590 [Shinella sp.]
MKIDVGSGGYGYSGPAYYTRREAVSAEIAEEAVSGRNTLNVSHTPISPSLANALWTVERERRSSKAAANANDETTGNPNGGVLDRYLEFAVSSTDEYH